MTKEICKNCGNCQPTYKGQYCNKDAKKKRVRQQDTCEDWRPKK